MDEEPAELIDPAELLAECRAVAARLATFQTLLERWIESGGLTDGG